MKKFAVLAVCLIVAGSAWAQVGTTNPNAINQDYVDWCQYGCSGGANASPQAWTSNMGFTGTVGLNGGFQDFYNLQQGGSWDGNFPSGMGLIYNGSILGNTPSSIVASFDTGVYAAGAYIQDDWVGPFTASITLYDQSYNPIATFSFNGNSTRSDPGHALFIGGYDTVPFWAVEFSVAGAGGVFEPDFSIGQMNINEAPEPGTLVLFGSSALGLAGYLRRRFQGVL